MRALFTCHPTFSHFLPLTPIAHALAEAGHDVAFGTPDSLRPAVEAAGFRWVRAGVENDDPEMAAVRASILELRGFDLDRFIHEHSFGTIRPRRMVPDLLALAESWRPDLFVHDSRECGALIAAELLDSPHIKVEVSATGVLPRHTPMLYEPLQRVRTTFGLPARPIQALMDEYLVLAPFPASLNLLDAPIAPTTHYFRGLPADDTAGSLPAWIDAIDARPLVYVSMGTSFSGDRRREIFSKLLEGLGDIEAIDGYGKVTVASCHPKHNSRDYNRKAADSISKTTYFIF